MFLPEDELHALFDPQVIPCGACRFRRAREQVHIERVSLMALRLSQYYILMRAGHGFMLVGCPVKIDQNPHSMDLVEPGLNLGLTTWKVICLRLMFLQGDTYKSKVGKNEPTKI